MQANNQDDRNQVLECTASICRSLGLDAQVRKGYIALVLNQRAVYLYLDDLSFRVEYQDKEFSVPICEVQKTISFLIAIVK